jgi:hypothetical protein
MKKNIRTIGVFIIIAALMLNCSALFVSAADGTYTKVVGTFEDNSIGYTSSAPGMCEAIASSIYPLEGSKSMNFTPTSSYDESDITLTQTALYPKATGYNGIVFRMRLDAQTKYVSMKIGIQASGGNNVWASTSPGTIKAIDMQGNDKTQNSANPDYLTFLGDFNGFVFIPFNTSFGNLDNGLKLNLLLGNGDWAGSYTYLDQVSYYKDSDFQSIINDLGYPNITITNPLLEKTSNIEMIEIDASTKTCIPSNAYLSVSTVTPTSTQTKQISDNYKSSDGNGLDSFKLYNIAFADNNGVVYNPKKELSGDAIITFPIPDGYNYFDIDILQISADGTITPLIASLYSVTNSVMAFASSTGTFAVVYKSPKLVTIKGKLVYSNYYPIANMKVGLDPLNITAKTDSAGNFTFNNVRLVDNKFSVLDSKGDVIVSCDLSIKLNDSTDLSNGIVGITNDVKSIDLFFVADNSQVKISDTGEELYQTNLNTIKVKNPANGQSNNSADNQTNDQSISKDNNQTSDHSNSQGESSASNSGTNPDTSDSYKILFVVIFFATSLLLILRNILTKRLYEKSSGKKTVD